MDLALVGAGSCPEAWKQASALSGAWPGWQCVELLRIAAAHTGRPAFVWHPVSRSGLWSGFVCQHSRDGGVLHKRDPVGATERALFFGRFLRRRSGGV